MNIKISHLLKKTNLPKLNNFLIAFTQHALLMTRLPTIKDHSPVSRHKITARSILINIIEVAIAIAAPIAPYLGISNMFNVILTSAASSIIQSGGDIKSAKFNIKLKIKNKSTLNAKLFKYDLVWARLLWR